MKKTKIFPLLIFVLLASSSCQTNKFVQNQLRSLRADLDYELTTSIYENEQNDTVYLNFIDNSNMEYFTTVKNSRGFFIPLILYYHAHKKFNIVLGEGTLTQTYREFLTDALLAECNRSGHFHLKSHDNDSISSDVYLLDVKVITNETLSAIKENSNLFFFPTTSAVFDFSWTDYQVSPAITDLKIAVSLKRGDNSLLEKNYFVHKDLTSAIRKSEDLFYAGEKCVFNMADCLSYATKDIVEEIRRDLNLILSVQ